MSGARGPATAGVPLPHEPGPELEAWYALLSAAVSE